MQSCSILLVASKRGYLSSEDGKKARKKENKMPKTKSRSGERGVSRKHRK